MTDICDPVAQVTEAFLAGDLVALGNGLDEVRAAVERDATRAQLDEVNEQLYDALRQKYPVRITANLPEGSGSDAR